MLVLDRFADLRIWCPGRGSRGTVGVGRRNGSRAEVAAVVGFAPWPFWFRPRQLRVGGRGEPRRATKRELASSRSGRGSRGRRRKKRKTTKRERKLEVRSRAAIAWFQRLRRLQERGLSSGVSSSPAASQAARQAMAWLPERGTQEERKRGRAEDGGDYDRGAGLIGATSCWMQTVVVGVCRHGLPGGRRRDCRPTSHMEMEMCLCTGAQPELGVEAPS